MSYSLFSTSIEYKPLKNLVVYSNQFSNSYELQPLMHNFAVCKPEN